MAPALQVQFHGCCFGFDDEDACLTSLGAMRGLEGTLTPDASPFEALIADFAAKAAPSPATMAEACETAVVIQTGQTMWKN